MEKAELKRHGKRLFLNSFFFAARRRRRAARALADDGSIDALRLLAKALIKSKDEEVRLVALQALVDTQAQLSEEERIVSALVSAMKDHDAEIRRAAQVFLIRHEAGAQRDALVRRLWRRWDKARNSKWEHAAQESSYVVDEPLDLKVLSAMKLGKRHEVTDIGKKVVEPLRKYCEDGDTDVAQEACVALSELKAQPAQEEVCRLVLEGQDEVAKEAALRGNYAPQNENQRAIFYLLTDQWDEYEALDHDHERLKAAYDAAEEGRRQIRPYRK